MDETNHMPVHTTFLGAILGSVKWLLVFVFAPAVTMVQEIAPQWKSELEDFKLIGGSIIIVLVVIKLVLEIVKLVKK